jgi:cobalt-zinc-cadmium efflux system outer membrane protein
VGKRESWLRWDCTPWLALMGVVSLSPVSAQPAQPLSLAEAVRLAQSRSPLARQADARVQGASGRVRTAGALPNPTLSVAHAYGSNTTAGFDEDLVLTQIFELGGKRNPRVRAARAEREAARAERQGTVLDVGFSTQSAYYEALRADAERGLAAEAVTTARAFATAAETQFQAGEVARSNVVRSRIELDRAEQALATAETERANRYAALQSLTGLPPDTPLTLTDTLAFSPVSYWLPDLQSFAAQHRPDLLAATQLREARAHSLREARAQSQPDLFLEGRRASVDPSIGGSSVRVGMTLPVFDLGRKRGDVEVARAGLREQEAALAEATRAAQLEVETAWRNLEQAQRAVTSFQSGRLDRARELLEMVRIGYGRGASSLLEVLDAQQVYRNEETEYSRALAAFNSAKAAVQRAVGGTLP